MRDEIEGVRKWRNEWANGGYASLALGGMDAPDVACIIVCWDVSYKLINEYERMDQ